MKKIELKSLAEYFGNFLPAGHITNRDTRIAIVRLYGTLAKANDKVSEEIEEFRKALVGDKQAEIVKYAQLVLKASDEQFSEDERKKFREEADAMTECVQIDKDFAEAQTRIYNEEITVDFKKIPLELLYDALADCGFPRFTPEMSISEVQTVFKDVIE